MGGRIGRRRVILVVGLKIGDVAGVVIVVIICVAVFWIFLDSGGNGRVLFGLRNPVAVIPRNHVAICDARVGQLHEGNEHVVVLYGRQHAFHHEKGQAGEEMIPGCAAFDEHALGMRIHSLDGVGVSAGDGIFEVL